MEFDDIKKAWKDSSKKDEWLDKNGIEALLDIRKKSNTALTKIKRSYKLEITLNSVLSIFLFIWIFFNAQPDKKFILLLIFFLLFAALIAFAFYNYNKIRKRIISTDQLRFALKITIQDVERYVNFNASNLMKYLLLPFSIAFGMGIGFFIGIGEKELADVFASMSKITIIRLAVTFVIFSVIFIPLSQYVNKKLYKNHLDELKTALKEFEEIEEDNN